MNLLFVCRSSCRTTALACSLLFVQGPPSLPLYPSSASLALPRYPVQIGIDSATRALRSRDAESPHLCCGEKPMCAMAGGSAARQRKPTRCADMLRHAQLHWPRPQQLNQREASSGACGIAAHAPPQQLWAPAMPALAPLLLRHSQAAERLNNRGMWIRAINQNSGSEVLRNSGRVGCSCRHAVEGCPQARSTPAASLLGTGARRCRALRPLRRHLRLRLFGQREEVGLNKVHLLTLELVLHAASA